MDNGLTSGYAAMTWVEAERAIPEADVVAVPFGSIEQHSRHLPLAVDSLRANTLLEQLVAEAASEGIDILRLPTLPYGFSPHHMPYPGTVTISLETYMELVLDICESLIRHGASRLLLFNCHGGNRQPISLTAERVQRRHDVSAHVVFWSDFARDWINEEFGELWGHAGPHETSFMLAHYPELVKEDEIVPQTMKPYLSTRTYRHFDEVSEEGGIGDPTVANPEEYRDIAEQVAPAILNALLEDIANESEL